MSFFNANVIIVDIPTNWLMSVDSPNSINRRLTGRRRFGYGAHAPRRRRGRRQTVNQQAGRTAYRPLDWIPEPDSRFRIVVSLAAGAWLSYRRSPQNTADEHEPVPDAAGTRHPCIGDGCCAQAASGMSQARGHRHRRLGASCSGWGIVLGHSPRRSWNTVTPGSGAHDVIGTASPRIASYLPEPCRP